MGFIDRIVSRSSKYGLDDEDRPSKADLRSPVRKVSLHGCTRRQTKAATPARPKANPRSYACTCAL